MAWVALARAKVRRAHGLGARRPVAAERFARRRSDCGGRRCAPTSLRCSSRGRAAELAARAARAPLRQTAASQRDEARFARRPRDCAARRRRSRAVARSARRPPAGGRPAREPSAPLRVDVLCSRNGRRRRPMIRFAPLVPGRRIVDDRGKREAGRSDPHGIVPNLRCPRNGKRTRRLRLRLCFRSLEKRFSGKAARVAPQARIPANEVVCRISGSP
jgi:hypothetical protein